MYPNKDFASWVCEGPYHLNHEELIASIKKMKDLYNDLEETIKDFEEELCMRIKYESEIEVTKKVRQLDQTLDLDTRIVKKPRVESEQEEE